LFGTDEFTTGVRSTYPWWKVSGAWPEDSSQQVLLGERLASRLDGKPGDEITLAGRQLRVSGVLSTGGAEDDEVVAPLGLAQEILGRPDAVKRVYVSALTKPEDAFARRDPKSLSGAIYDRWYCTPYPQAIALQLTEAMSHSHAEQIRQVSQNEGAVLTRIEGLIFLITLAALFSSVLAVSAAMATAIFERRAEVGLMKALGAGKLAVASIFFAEATLLALIGGLAGFAVGSVLAHQIGHSIFNSDISIPPVLLPVILAIAVIVTFAGSAAAIRRAVGLDPVFALRGEL
jgi:putative ABC transport system permease protein